MNADTATELYWLRKLELEARAIANGDMDETYPGLHATLDKLDTARGLIRQRQAIEKALS